MQPDRTYTSNDPDGFAVRAAARVASDAYRQARLLGIISELRQENIYLRQWIWALAGLALTGWAPAITLAIWWAS